MSRVPESGYQGPWVSIGLPVYNEERHLRATIDSLLAQDFKGLELVISDNASEDQTGEICREYAAKDARIRYYRNEVNLGPIANFNRVFELSRGTYFMWASGHDLWAPGFISRCVEILECDPGVVLCYPRVQRIDEEGRPVATLDTYLDTRGQSLPRRFSLTLWQFGSGCMIYGLIRSESLRATRLSRKVWGPDRLVLVELAMLGAFANLQETLFYARDKWGMRDLPLMKRRRSHFQRLYPQDQPRFMWWFPELLGTYEQLLAVKHSRLGYAQKLLLLACVIIVYFLRFYRFIPLCIRRRLRGLFARLGIVPAPS